MSTRKLTEMQRVAPAVALAALKSDNPTTGKEAADKLMREAKEFGLSFGDFLDLKINPRVGENPEQFALSENRFLRGRDVAALYLGLPHQNNFEEGILLQMASDTFQTYPGTRAMFPEVIDSMLRWKNRQSQLENLDALIAQTRSINGNEMISTVVDDDSVARGTFIVAEMGEIPVRTIKTSQQGVRIFKHGSGIRTSYEFERRASLDILTPFAARVARDLEISKVKAATNMLVNGDGVNPGALVEGISQFGGVAYNALDKSTYLRNQYPAIAQWLVQKAAAMTPIDTIVGNLSMYLELLFMFTPTLPSNYSAAEVLAGKGAPTINVSMPLLNSSVNFALSSSMADGMILGYSKAETLEQLVEAGSSISENEKAVSNQTLSYYKTENTGFRLVFGDTRFILNTKA